MKFQIDPLVVFKLGEDLISDDVQALVELVKNAYDADASYAKVSIKTRGPADLELSESKSDGSIVVEDDGTGMTRGDVEQGWLFIATSSKRALKARNGTTGRGRTPLGDKGLGRLGAQRLGSDLEIATKVADEKTELVVGFSWDDFVDAGSLDAVTVLDARRPTERRHGTKITIGGLRDPGHWRDSILHLQTELSRMISPYEEISDFRIVALVDGTPLDLLSMTRRVRETARIHYDIDFDGRQLRVKGRARLSFFRPQSTKEVQEFLRLTGDDAGERFRQYLLERRGATSFRLEPARGGWFVTFEMEQEFDAVATARADGELANPGVFRAEVEGFSLAAGDEGSTEVFGSLSDYRRYVRELSGVRIYRDGFAVRTDRDWLNLAGQITGGRSFLGLRPDTTIGYVAISARDNAVLIETTDREGFLDTPHFRNFSSLLDGFVKFSSEAQAFLGRSWADYRRSLITEASGVDDPSPEAVSADIASTAAAATPLRTQLASARTELTSAVATARGGVNVPEATVALNDALASSAAVLDRVEAYLQEVGAVGAKTSVIAEEVQALRAQIDLSAETMGLGLIAEALSHEMFNIADALASRTDAIRGHLQRQQITDSEILRYVEHVRSTTRALRKELGHFAPALRFVRDRRETFPMGAFLGDQADYYNERWTGKIHLAVDVRKDFDVRISRGKLGQVFDNLFLNSEYWLQKAPNASSRSQVGKPRVSVVLNVPYVSVSDSGPGIDPAVEETLFDPFVTRKPRGLGRGLGLYIVRQLLQSEGCSIELGGRRDSRGRLREFVIDFASIMQ